MVDRNLVRVLRLLNDGGPINAEDIENNLHLSPQTLARIDDALVKAGMAQRVRGHKHTYEITDFGRSGLPTLEQIVRSQPR
jgi:DNA-binding HxlR family transcriptional regulator